MTLIDDGEEVRREVVDQAVRRLPRPAPVEVTRVVLDPRAEPDRLQHLEVVVRPHLQPLRLEQLALGAEEGQPLVQLVSDGHESRLQSFRDGDVVCGGPDGHGLEPRDDLAAHLVDLDDRLHLVAEELDAQGPLGVGREDVEHVAAHPEGPASEVVVVAVVLDVDETADQHVAVQVAAHFEEDSTARVVLRRPDAVDAAHGRDHDDVTTREQRRRGGVAKPLDLLVDRGVLLDERVGGGDVGLGLVVVVVGDEIYDRVVRHQVLELGRELGRERLVRRHHQRRPLHRLDGLGHRERLARAGDPEERLMGRAGADALGESRDGGGLVAGRLVRGLDSEPVAQLPDAPSRCRSLAGHLPSNACG